MAHYAYIDENNIVVSVITGRDEDDLAPGVTSWEEYYGAQRPGLRCLRTSYNTRANQHSGDGTPFRGNYAGKGYTYYEEEDVFVPPQPYPSWVLSPETVNWEAPVAYPEDGEDYTWNEETGAWDAVSPE